MIFPPSEKDSGHVHAEGHASQNGDTGFNPINDEVQPLSARTKGVYSRA